MPKYLFRINYTAEGTKGLIRDGGSKRQTFGKPPSTIFCARSFAAKTRVNVMPLLAMVSAISTHCAALVSSDAVMASAKASARAASLSFASVCDIISILFPLSIYFTISPAGGFQLV